MSNQTLFTVTIFYSLVLFLPVAAVILWRKPTLWIYLLTAFIGFIIGWWDLRITEVSAPVLLLLTFGFFFGFAHPRRAWLGAILLGMWIPILAIIAASLNVVQPEQPLSLASLLVFVFPLVGAYAGVLLSRVAPREKGSLLNG